jgi:Cu2+-exporting ATPase
MMKTSVIEVHDMLSVLTVDEVEKRFGEVPGVASATVNYAAGNATVRYDETLLEVADIKVIVHQRGQQSAGESQVKDVSEGKPEHKPVVKPTPEAAPASASPPEPAVPKSSPVAPATAPKPAAPAGDGQQDEEAPAAPPSTPAAAKEE